MPLRLAAAVCLAALALPARGQIVLEAADGFAFRLAGTVQPRVSVGVERGSEDRERFGFGLRRVRLESRVTWRETLGFEFDIDGASGDVRPVDMYGVWYLSDRLQVRAGQIVGAQPRGANETSHREIDAVDRAAIFGRWADGALGSSGRDIGLDVLYEGPATELELFVHDGSGIFSREEANFRESIESGSVTRGVDRVGVAVSGAVRHAPPSLPGVEVGAYASANVGGNPRTAVGGVERSYVSGAAHLYWGAEPGSQPVRLKADAIALAYEAAGGVDARRAGGVSGLAAVGVARGAEVFGRAEGYWPEASPAETYLTAGASVSPSAAAGGRYRTARLTAAYSWRTIGDETAHLGVVQAQFAF